MVDNLKVSKKRTSSSNVGRSLRCSSRWILLHDDPQRDNAEKTHRRRDAQDILPMPRRSVYESGDDESTPGADYKSGGKMNVCSWGGGR